jgi:D-amino-acid dehydrogenase
MSIPTRRVVVIGGGVIGTACAHYLSRSGWSVTVVDKGRHGSGSSWGNCGLVCPSHVLPLAEPGMVAQALGSMFKKNSPFAIKFRHDASLWSWLIHFAMRCNERDMLEAGRGIQPLLETSLELYRGLVEQEGLQCEWERKGLLFAYRSRGPMDAYAHTDRLMGEKFRCHAQRYDGDAVFEL